jgi:hypothetical protein
MRREYTVEEMKQLDQAIQNLRQNGFDNVTEEGVQNNADLLDKYFQQNPNVPVTVQNVYQAVEAQKTNFKWLSPAQSEYHRVAAENPAESSTKLTAWFSTQGKPGMLTNTGDEGHENFSILLAELRGREVNQTTIQQAIGRIAYNGRRQLHVVPVPHKVDPRSHVATDDGSGFLKQDMVKNADGSWRSKSPAEYAADRRLAEAQKNPGQADKIIERQAQAEAESLQGNTHSQTDQIRKLFVTKQYSSDIDWVITLNARKRMQKQFERSSAVSFRRY